MWFWRSFMWCRTVAHGAPRTPPGYSSLSVLTTLRQGSGVVGLTGVMLLWSREEGSQLELERIDGGS